MNDYIVTLTNDDGECDQVLMEGFANGTKAALQAEEDYNRKGWHHARVRMISKESE